MIVSARQLERVVISADARILAISLNNQGGYESAKLKEEDITVKLFRRGDEWHMQPFSVKNRIAFFNIADTSDMDRGLYKAEFWMNDCLVDKFEIQKAPSHYISAQVTEDSCSDGVWTEQCSIEPPLCKTTREPVCGCGEGCCGGVEPCPACLGEQVILVGENKLAGYR